MLYGTKDAVEEADILKLETALILRTSFEIR